MLKPGLAITLLGGLSWTALAIPMDSAFTSSASAFQQQELTTGAQALGNVCYSRDVMPDGMICNPAFLTEQPDSTLLARVYFGNGYTALSTANSLVYQPISKDFLQGLFQGGVTSVQAHLQLMFATKYFSAEFSPYRVQFLSQIQNPALPVISVAATIERSITLSGGVPIHPFAQKFGDFTLGTRLHLIQRDYVDGQFSFLQAVGTDPRALLPVNTQYGVLLDPALGWVGSAVPWKPRASLSLSNVGFVWPRDPLFDTSADVNLGFAVEPPVGFGRLRAGVDLVSLIHAPDLLSRVRIGTSYKFGILEALAGFNVNAITAGLQFGLNVFQAGITYEFVRDDFGLTSPESRISTEVSIRL